MTNHVFTGLWAALGIINISLHDWEKAVMCALIVVLHIQNEQLAKTQKEGAN